MKKFLNVKGYQEIVPLIEVNVDTVYVRSNIVRVQTEEFTGWQYDETQYDKNEYIENIHSLKIENVKLQQENELLKQEDLNNKEAILELYMLALGGF